MRILFTVANSPSHIRALVPVIRAAEASGHTVGIATGAMSAEDIAAYGIDHLPAGLDILDLVARTLEKTGMTFAELTAMERTVDFFIGSPAEAMAKDIIDSGWNPDVIVRSTLEFGGVLAAEVLGVPHASVAIGGAVNVISPPSTLAPLMAPLRASFGLPPDPTGEANFRHLHACLMPETYDPAEAAIPRSKFYRHENPGRRGDAIPPVLAGLPTDKPWVFAALGTLAAFASDGLSLLKSVVTAVAQLDCVAVISTGPGVVSQEFGSLPPTAVLVESVPQPLLLERCDLFITHAGHNSVREAMRCGVPLVCTPMFSEQPYNARRCAETGVGEQLCTETMTADEVLTACREVLENPRYRSNARRIRRDMLALPPLEAFVADLESLVGSGPRGLHRDPVTVIPARTGLVIGRTPGAPDSPLLDRIRRGLIGDHEVLDGPYGPRRVIYADYTASGKALDFVEDFVRAQVLPHYANTHTESSGTGRYTTGLREQARRLIRDSVGGTEDDLVIFCGSGVTAAVTKLIGILEIRLPAGLDEKYSLVDRIPRDERPVVFVGPYEHHSNELPWRESIADVVVIGEDDRGQVDLADLRRQLLRHARRPLRIGSFSAGSNVTGVLTDTDAIATLLHDHGALSFWDYAAAGPHVPIRVRESAPGRGDHKDAVFLSPHKFVGGPQTPGVLVVRRELVTNSVPTAPGGGTVAFVHPRGHRYLDDPVAREEGGTPAIAESIRAGLVFALKDAVGAEVIQAREERLWRHVLAEWEQEPGIEILGNHDVDRLSIVSFRIRTGDRFLHHDFVVAVLNDLFGIQSRGGCSCAGPYGHRLLHIDTERSDGYDRNAAIGCHGVKPGWVRLNFSYLVTDTVRDYLVEAVRLVARYGHRLLTDYVFDPRAGLWRHRRTAHVPPALPDLRSAVLTPAPVSSPHADDTALATQLEDARRLLMARADVVQEGPTGLPEDFEALRWFVLPPHCLVD